MARSRGGNSVIASDHKASRFWASSRTAPPLTPDFRWHKRICCSAADEISHGDESAIMTFGIELFYTLLAGRTWLCPRRIPLLLSCELDNLLGKSYHMSFLGTTIYIPNFIQIRLIVSEPIQRKQSNKSFYNHFIILL